MKRLLFTLLLLLVSVSAFATRLSEARGRLFDRELMMLVDMRSVLTDTQWNHMRTLLERLGNAAQQMPQQRMRPKNR